MDAEESMIAHLREALGVPCSSDVPRKRPASFVTVERAGGGGDGYTDAAQLAVQCWGPTKADAHALALLARAALPAWEELDRAVSCSCRVAVLVPGEGRAALPAHGGSENHI